MQLPHLSLPQPWGVRWDGSVGIPWGPTPGGRVLWPPGPRDPGDRSPGSPGPIFTHPSAPRGSQEPGGESLGHWWCEFRFLIWYSSIDACLRSNGGNRLVEGRRLRAPSTFTIFLAGCSPAHSALFFCCGCSPMFPCPHPDAATTIIFADGAMLQLHPFLFLF